MKILISSAKKMRKPGPSPLPSSSPVFINESLELTKILQNKHHDEIKKLMNLSDVLTTLNVQRYFQWDMQSKPTHAKPAILTFDGAVYRGIQPETLSIEDLSLAQKQLLILSGLYGILSPLDEIQPYRLEMGTKLKNNLGTNLYSFWQERITAYLNKVEQKLIIKLASKEYFKAIKSQELVAKVVTPIFKDCKNGKYKIVSFHAKRARGLMVRYLIQNNITTLDQLKQFNKEGYYFSSSDSTNHDLVFLRKEK
jgi:cytoplasmic iron level regulating protein YaaA (DUF328/UPF0246 family)